MQPMSSMQTTLLPGVTPGWNDPPPLGNPSSGSRLNRYRRVVDPSLTAAGGSPVPYAASSPQQGMPMGMANGMTPPQSMQPVQHMQPVQQQYYAQPGYSMPGSNSVAPTGGFGTTPQEQQQQQLHMQQQYPQQHHQSPPAAIPPPSHPSIPPSVTTPGPIPMSPYQQPGGGQVVNITHHTQYDNGMYNMHGLNQSAQMVNQHHEGQMNNLYSTEPSSHSTPQINYMGGGDTSGTLVFTPPNTVPGEDDSYVDSLNYKPPMKAPGDVSLNGSKLVEFLVKGAVKLPQAKSHGVQMGLKTLKGEIGEMSKDDPFIKKFNYVVDAVDRESFDEAYRHLEEMLVSFPQQTRVPEGGQQERKWIGSVRFLIKELPLRNATVRNH